MRRKGTVSIIIMVILIAGAVTLAIFRAGKIKEYRAYNSQLKQNIQELKTKQKDTAAELDKLKKDNEAMDKKLKK